MLKQQIPTINKVTDKEKKNKLIKQVNDDVKRNSKTKKKQKTKTAFVHNLDFGARKADGCERL